MLLLILGCVAAFSKISTYPVTSKVTEKSESMIESQETLNKVIEEAAIQLDISVEESTSRVTDFFESQNCLSPSNDLLSPFANCWADEEKTIDDMSWIEEAKFIPIDVCPIQQVIPAQSAGFPSGGPVLDGVPMLLEDQCFGFVVDCFDLPVECYHCAWYRTIDGTCNNLYVNTKWGSINRAFRRFVSNNYENSIDEPTGGNPPTGVLPTPRDISNWIHHHPSPPIDYHHTHMLMQLGQFLDHDITFTPEVDVKDCCSVSSSECFPLEINQPDLYLPFVNCLHFARSAPKCAAMGIRNQFNAITAYVDGSQIYGSTDAESLNLRTMVDGKLKTSDGDNLPLNSASGGYGGGGCLLGNQFAAGDRRVTENPGLQCLHTIFMREHNRIAGIINLLTTWNDERIYQEARRIVVAEWQNIVYGEFLPAILGVNGVPHGVNSVYDSTVDATINNVFATAAFRFGHSLITGKVKISPTGSYLLDDNFGDTREILNNGNLDGILKGATEQNTDASDRFIHNSVRNNLFQNIPCHKDGGDLLARNIQRGRDHGLGTYSDYWSSCGFPGQPDVHPDLLALYGGVVEKVEIFPGGLLEEHVTDGLVGQTFHCLIKEQFQRLKDGDRFFFTHEKGEPCDINLQRFTEDQQTLIMGRKLRDVMCDNSGITVLQADVLKIIDPASNPLQGCISGNPLDVGEIESLLIM